MEVLRRAEWVVGWGPHVLVWELASDRLAPEAWQRWVGPQARSQPAARVAQLAWACQPPVQEQQMAPRPALWILKFQVEPLPPLARRTDRRSPRLNPADSCRNGRAQRLVGKIAFQKTSSTILRRSPPFGHGGDEAHTLGQAPCVERLLELARFSARRSRSSNAGAVHFLGPVRKARHPVLA